MSSTGDVSLRARGRIIGFSVVLSMVMLVVIALIATQLFQGGAVGTPDGGRITTSDDYYYPWENPSPTAAQQDGEAWHGRGQQYIPLTGLTPGAPLLITFDAEDKPSSVFLSQNPQLAEGIDPIEFHSYDEPLYLIPTSSQAVVWLRARTADPWTARIEPAPLEQKSGSVSGVGSQTFLYTGEASAARVTVRGSSSLRVSITTAAGTDADSETFENSSGSVSWIDSPSVIVTVQDYAEDAGWTIQFLEPPPPATPEPTGSPAPETTGTDDE